MGGGRAGGVIAAFFCIFWAGCSGGSGDPDIGDWEFHAGRNELELAGTLGLSDKGLYAEFWSVPVFATSDFATYPYGYYEESAIIGDCRYFVPADVACNPPCGSGQRCLPGNECAEVAESVSAGDLTWTVNGESVVVSPTYWETGLTDDSMHGYWSYRLDNPFTFDHLSSGYSISVDAAGDAFPAFHVEVPWLDSELVMDDESLEMNLRSGEDYRVAWEPVQTGGTVRLTMRKGNHGSPPSIVVVCEQHPAVGKIVIDAAIVDEFMAAYNLGGIQHGSAIGLFQRTVVDTAVGPVQLSVGQGTGLHIPCTDVM